MRNQKGFIQIPLLIAILIVSVSVASVGTGVVLHKQGKLSPLVANVAEVLKDIQNTTITEEEDIKEDIKSQELQAEEELEINQEGNHQQEFKKIRIDVEEKKTEAERDEKQVEQEQHKEKIELQMANLLEQVTLLQQQIQEIKNFQTQSQDVKSFTQENFPEANTLAPFPATTSNLDTTTTQEIIIPQFAVEIFSDKNEVKNDGIDYTVLTIIIKLSNGQIIPNKLVEISENIETIIGDKRILSNVPKEPYISNQDGYIYYETKTTIAVPSCCSSYNKVITVEVDGVFYKKTIDIINVQPIKCGGVCA